MGLRRTFRDDTLLHYLLAAHYLTTRQIELLLWQEGDSARGRTVACRRRLLKLTKQRIIRRIEIPVKRREAPHPYVYCLDKVGAEILVADYGVDPKDIDWKPKSREENYPFLEHIIRCNDLHIALMLACEKHSVELVSFMHERELKSEGMKDYVTLESFDGLKQERAAVVPDMYWALRVRVGDGQAGHKLGHLFAEVDLGSVVIQPTVWERRSWVRRVRAYLAYAASGVFQKRYNATAFRVLCVCTAEGRMQNLRAATQQENGGRMFWFSTFEQLTPEAILTQPVWLTAEGDTPVAILG